MPPFSFASAGPGLRFAGPVGLLSGFTSPPLNRFLLYKHPLSLIYTLSLKRHVKNRRHLTSAPIPLGFTTRHVKTGRHLTSTFIPLRFITPFTFRLIMPGPMRRTLSYKASDFLKSEYRQPGTPDSNPEQSSSSTSNPGPSVPRGRRRGRSSRDWCIPPERDTDWAMSSASESSEPEESPGSSRRVSTRSHTRCSTHLNSPATGAEPDDDTSTGGVAASLAESSPDAATDRPPCAAASYQGSLGPICSVPCAVRDLTESPFPRRSTGTSRAHAA